MNTFNYYNPTRYIIGEGTFGELATMELPGKKALIVVTPERFYVDQAIEYLKAQNIESVVFDEVRPNPSTTGVNKAAKIARDNGCDFLLSIGGGSSTDTAKGIAVAMKNEGDVWDYMPYHDDYKEFTEAAPIVVVSTTSGTGTEADCFGVLTNDDLDAKVDIVSETLFPCISIIDPCLQVSLPKGLTAAQGMDVIYHVTEEYLNIYHTPYGDMLATTGLRYANENLVKAYNDGSDLEARSGMALASNLAGIGFCQASTMSQHAFGHSISALSNKTPHGVAISIISPEVMQYYCDNGYADRLADLAKVVGRETAQDYVDWIIDTLKAVDLYAIDLDRFEIDYNNPDAYAENCTGTLACYHDNDIEPMSYETARDIFDKAFKRHISLKQK